ncbi:hypothetical protein [Halorubrum distributum]|uniref:Uncharacterized protein n=1 Tax=Halorubrum distributum TaxID=29283 RepID=A0A6B1IU76_9EURY|nr:hypothetical protein [Halorubrum terrestre]MYL66615.1 hypothetical protein [Halorubrum terrestre]
MTDRTSYVDDFPFIPKAKSDPFALREYLKLCKKISLEGDEETFTRDALGEKAIETDTIRPGPISDERYDKKYADASSSFVPKKTSAKGFLKIARMFGWIRYVPDESQTYRLTTRGEAISRFEGTFPDTQGELSERDLFIKSLQNWTVHSMNYSPRGRKMYDEFSVRIGFTALYFLKHYSPLSRREIALTSIPVTDERDGKAIEPHLERVQNFVKGETTFAEAYSEFGLEPTVDKQIREPVERPKILLPFCEKLSLCTGRKISSYDEETKEQLKNRYEKLCEGEFRGGKPRKVFELTEEGEAFVNTQLRKVKLWYDELGRCRTEKAALLILLIEGDREASDLLEISENLHERIDELRLSNNLEFSVGDTISLETSVAFDFFQEVPPEVCHEVRELVECVDESVLSYDFSDVERPVIDLSASDIPIESELNDVRPEPAVPLTWDEEEPHNSLADQRWNEVRAVADSIEQTSDGQILIHDETCPGVLLCALKDPLNTIKVAEDGRCTIEEYNPEDVCQVRASATEREEITQQNIESYRKEQQKLSKETVRSLVHSLDEQTSEWNDAPYYTFVRNCLRLLDITADYTGGPGVHEIDIRTYDPFYASIEVKTVKEGLGVSAVRQPITDIASEFPERAERHEVVIGPDPSSPAIEVARQQGVSILRTQYLLFILLLDAHLNIETKEYEELFRVNVGEITTENIESFYQEILSESDHNTAKDYIKHCLD